MKLLDKYDVGIYCRLSREDFKNGKNDTSMSIENQRRILENSVKERGWNLNPNHVYVDDGFTGVNFNRPAFNRMLRDLKLGKINCVMVKNLDRFGRGAKTGVYIEEHFVEPQVRFIALGENVDTATNSDELIDFYHAMSGIYPKMVSKKVRATKRENAAAGMFMNSQAPYGYIKSPEDKHKLIIDEEAAKIVLQIFKDYVGGDSARMIADKLNAEKVDCPSFYHYGKKGTTPPSQMRKRGGEHYLWKPSNVWGSATVTQLLRNEAYIGRMVSSKRQVTSIVTKKIRKNDKADWIRVEGTHTAIITQKLWDEAQKRLETRARVYESKRTKTVGMFAGVLRCADCGRPLAYTVKNLKDSSKGVYRCSKYNNNGKNGENACTSHYIDEGSLADIVLAEVRGHAVLSAFARESLTKRLMASLRQNQNSEASEIKARICKLESRLEVIDATDRELYEDKAAKRISEEKYRKRISEYEKEQSIIEAELPKLRADLENVHQATSDVDDWLAMIEACLNLETLDRKTVTGLIDHITVSERVKAEGKTQQEIVISYRFIGSLLHDNGSDTKKDDVV